MERWLLFGALALTACAARSAGPSDASLSRARRAEPDGSRSYNLHCASCHGEWGSGPDAPRIMGPGVFADYATAKELLGYVQHSMPPDDPGSLPAHDYESIVAYLLRASNVTLPTEGLSATNANQVRLK